MSLRAKVLFEISIIAVLTAIFLILFPRRITIVDVGLASLALIGIGLSARYTRNVIWATIPKAADEDRRRGCLLITFWITVPVAIVFLVVGMMVAYRKGGWPAVVHREFNWRIMAAFACYFPWALMQQTLLQFYLLGRLLVLFPSRWWFVPFLMTGLCFGLVHWPDWWTALATVIAGALWSFIYYRYRMLWPLALSHAALGTAFYYGVFGHDLFTEWHTSLP